MKIKNLLKGVKMSNEAKEFNFRERIMMTIVVNATVLIRNLLMSLKQIANFSILKLMKIIYVIYTTPIGRGIDIEPN